MTVKELINELKKYPENYKIFLRGERFEYLYPINKVKEKNICYKKDEFCLSNYFDKDECIENCDAEFRGLIIG